MVLRASSGYDSVISFLDISFFDVSIGVSFEDTHSELYHNTARTRQPAIALSVISVKNRELIEMTSSQSP